MKKPPLGRFQLTPSSAAWGSRAARPSSTRSRLRRYTSISRVLAFTRLRPWSRSSPPITAWATGGVLTVTMLLSLDSWSANGTVRPPPTSTGWSATA